MPSLEPHVIDLKIKPSFIPLHIAAFLNGYSALHVISVGPFSLKAYSLIYTIGPLQPEGGNNAPSLLPVKEALIKRNFSHYIIQNNDCKFELKSQSFE